MSMNNVMLCLVLACISARCAAQAPFLEMEGTKPATPETAQNLTQRFYSMNGNRIFWLDSASNGKLNALLDCFQHADAYGLISASYHTGALQQHRRGNPLATGDLLAADKAVTGMAFSFIKDLYQGRELSRWISYDGISSRYAAADNDYLLEGLSRVRDSAGLIAFIHGLEPQTEEYRLMKQALAGLRNGDTVRLRKKQLVTSLNYYRWIRHFHLDSFIVINIAAATLKYYRADTIALTMRTIMGTPDRRTPRFAAYCKEVTLYPYWNMPRSILVNEWLRSFKKSPGLITFMNMEVIDAKGRVVSPHSINWSRVSSSNFPYRIREKTGCFNPLGVLKFTLTSPYDVYLHDTNFKGAFLSSNRFYSHGCIRIEDPVGLADAVLVKKVDTNFLKACYRNQQPQVIPIAAPVPVFVVYMCAEAQPDGIVHYYKDVYGLLK